MSDGSASGGQDNVDSPQTAARKLKDRVTFFERIWTGADSSRAQETGQQLPINVEELERKLLEEKRNEQARIEHVQLRATPISSPVRDVGLQPIFRTPVDVSRLEKRLEEERKKHVEHARLEHVTLRHTQHPSHESSPTVHFQHVSLKSTPLSSPKRPLIREIPFVESPTRLDDTTIKYKNLQEDKQKAKDDDSFEESYARTIEEGDFSSGSRVVKFEQIIVKKSVKEVTVKPLSSRTPSEEHILEDSAYHSHGNGISKSSSIASLTGRFASEESLKSRTPSRENVTRDEWDASSSSSKHTTSGSDWYNEYKTQSFLHSGTKLDFVRSKSQYDSHIAEIRGEVCLHSHQPTVAINYNCAKRLNNYF